MIYEKKVMIWDELCTCGHLKSNHFNTLAKGHGPCADADQLFPEVKQCKCKQFTWFKFLYEEVE